MTVRSGSNSMTSGCRRRSTRSTARSSPSGATSAAAKARASVGGVRASRPGDEVRVGGAGQRRAAAPSTARGWLTTRRHGSVIRGAPSRPPRSGLPPPRWRPAASSSTQPRVPARSRYASWTASRNASSSSSRRSRAAPKRSVATSGGRSRTMTRSGSSPPVAMPFTISIAGTPSPRPTPWYARDDGTKRSLTTQSPRASAGRTTSSTCCARSAAMSSASASGSTVRGRRRAAAGGARRRGRCRRARTWRATSRPSARSRAASRAVWVVLPVASPPSSTTNLPGRRFIGERGGEDRHRRCIG